MNWPTLSFIAYNYWRYDTLWSKLKAFARSNCRTTLSKWRWTNEQIPGIPLLFTTTSNGLTKLLKQSNYEIEGKLKVANEKYDFSNCNKSHAPPIGCTHTVAKSWAKSNVVTSDRM
jgi:hypothetical protein